MVAMRFNELIFRAEKTIYFLLSICLVFYISSYHLVKYILPLAGVLVLILFVLQPEKYFSRFSKIDIVWIAIITFYPFSYYLSFLIHGGEMDLSRANHVLIDCITALILFLLLRKKDFFTLKSFCRITAASIAIAGTAVIWEWSTHDFQGRWTVGTHLWLIYATVASAASLMCFWYFANSNEKIGFRLVFLYAAIAGVISIIAAGTRGALSITIFMFCLYFFVGILKGKKELLIIPVVVVAVSALWVMQADIGNKRFHDSIAVVEKFIQTGEITDFSIAQRVEMWRVAIKQIEEHPIVGVGNGKLGNTFIDPGFRYNTLYKFTHVHNEILQAWSALGVPGLISIFMLIGGPVWIALKGKSPITPYLIILALTFGLNGLVEVPFLKTYSLKYYMIVASLLITIHQKYISNSKYDVT